MHQTPGRPDPVLQCAQPNQPALKSDNNMFHQDLGRSARWLVAACAIMAATACGGDDDVSTGSGSLRVINATADVDAIDLTVEGVDDSNDDDGEQRFAAGVLRDGQTEYASINNGTWRVRLKRTDANSSLALNAVGINKDERHTLFAYGREGDYRLYAALDVEDEPSAGKSKVRIFNAAVDAGSVDVYLTETSAQLNDTLATASNVATARLDNYVTLARGTYRLRVTAAGDKNDVRLDVDGVELADKSRVTIVLQSGPGGVLVNTLISQYQGQVSALKNRFARARLVAGTSNNAAVTASLGGTSLNVNLRSPSIASYTMVPAGTSTASIQVNATTALSGSVTLAAGGDYTVAVYGEASAPSWRLLADDNRPPAVSDRVKLRLLHLAFGVDSALTLVKDYVGVASDVAYGNASSYTQLSTTTAASRLEVTSPFSTTPLFLAEDVGLPSGGVFTVFMLGGATTPTGVLRRDR
jgi:subtilisin-like proprotein convertase family protein